MAEESNPDQRAPYYEEMLQTGGSPELQQDPWMGEKEALLTRAYETEFTQGEASLGSDGAVAITHFRNAMTLRPSEADPYRHLSSLYYRDDQIPEAVKLLVRARDLIPSFPADLQERLAFLYLESGEVERAIEQYQELVEMAPDQVEVRHALVNAYILNENHTNAVDELRTLLEQEPTELLYRQSLATELFFHLQDHWRETPPAARSEQEIRNDLAWVDEAIEQLEAFDNEPAGVDQSYSLAQFYKQSGLYLLQEAETLPERHATELISRGEYLLKESVPHWRHLTEQTPGNREIWLHLQEIYRELGLEEQVQQIESELESQAAES